MFCCRGNHVCRFIFGSLLLGKKKKQKAEKPTAITSQLLNYANQL